MSLGRKEAKNKWLDNILVGIAKTKKGPNQLDLRHFDDISIDAMSGSVEAAIIAPVAVFSTGLALRAAMSIHALGVVALQPIPTGSHPGDGDEDKVFTFSQFAVVVVGTIIVRAGALYVVEIAEFQFFHTVQFVLGEGFEVEPVHSLAVFISLYDLGMRGDRRFGTHDLEVSRGL